MKILTFSTLFPSSNRSNHGIFVETRLKYLVESGEVESKIVAPVPWFPFTHSSFGEYAKFAGTPRRELRHGLNVIHPRYLSLPKIGMAIAPYLLEKAVRPVIKNILENGYDFDLIDAHYFYPDGVAAVALGNYFNKPVVITARGSDITQITQYEIPRKMIRSAAANAAGVITVCNALRDEIINLGVSPEKITTLRNGVNLHLFQPIDRDSVRSSLGLKQFTILSVGNLVPVKGHELTIAALPMLPDTRLLIAGDGPERKRLTDLAYKIGVSERVTFLGILSQEKLKNFYGAADVLILSSSREGWANVLLESMACGTPVVASNVWGTPEVVADPSAGLLMPARTPSSIAETVTQLRVNYPDRAATRQYAEKFSWTDTTEGQIQLFKKILNGGQHKNTLSNNLKSTNLQNKIDSFNSQY